MYRRIAFTIVTLGIALQGLPATAQGTITTVAGNGSQVFAGDGGAALNAGLNHPRGLAVSASGQVYITDVDNRRIRTVTTTGIITTLAGNGLSAAAGDGGLAVNASISDAMGLALDAAGNLYIADASNRRVRRVTPGGMITTIAGIGTEGFSGDGGAATSAMLGRPSGIAVDAAGNLYIADSSNQRVRRVDANGNITTIAGNGVPGFSGDGGAATSASLHTPIGVAVDRFSNVYIADGDNNRIRVIRNGIITTFAGTGAGSNTGDGGLATGAALNVPSDVAVDGNGNVYIADAGNNRVRRVDAAGTITTVAGTGTAGFGGDGGMATSASLNYPWGLATDVVGNVYIADRANSRVRKIAYAPLPTLGPPSLQDYSVVNGASFLRFVPIAPGAIATIFGTDFAMSAASATTVPLPTTLGETSVTFNGIPAPLFYVSPTQINVQAPFELAMGVATVQVRRGSSVSSARVFNVNSISPGIFVMDSSNSGAILHADFRLVTSSSPARPGETVLIFCTGLGPVRGNIRSGEKAPSTPPLADTLSLPTVSVGGSLATVAFSGLAPGFIGLYQVNATIPLTVATGNQPVQMPVQIMMGGIASNTAMVTVAR